MNYNFFVIEVAVDNGVAAGVFTYKRGNGYDDYVTNPLACSRYSNIEAAELALDTIANTINHPVCASGLLKLLPQPEGDEHFATTVTFKIVSVVLYSWASPENSVKDNCKTMKFALKKEPDLKFTVLQLPS